MNLALAETELENCILVVDDSVESLRFLYDTLESAGMTVLVATSGDEALEKLRAITPELILMDALMPGRDGFDTTRAIKENPALAHIPVVFMTGLTESEHALRAFEAGSVDYVRKPIVVEELLARINVHLRNAQTSHRRQQALDVEGRHLVAVNSQGMIVWATPQSEQLLAEITLEAGSGEENSPPLVSAFRKLAAANQSVGSSIRVELSGITIDLTVAGRKRDGEMLIRVSANREGQELDLLRDRFNLTSREAEVLYWISHGKPNRVIGEVLGISPRTVNKHLEQIFEKLGVETRAAAAAFAIRTLLG